ncbi:MAG: hypothetical protein KDJ26_02915 [Alphaproteobacteria bacterium]|nr:hypothetical protein [Alphaproteobacteria bacterium]MCB9985758.1 hypothetical protein [Micavibrio sp.]HPQ50570.1 hypothetical protein [Alphaproteobacteria bacterium]
MHRTNDTKQTHNSQRDDMALQTNIEQKKQVKTFLAFALVFIMLMMPYRSAMACGSCTDCGTWQSYITQEMNTHKSWMTTEWWDAKLKPAMQGNTDVSRNSIVGAAMMIGAFLDGESELNSLRALQELNAQTLNDYSVSDSICKFGTLSRSLALSESKGRVNQIVLSERSQNRQLGHDNMASEEGAQKDRMARYKQFTSTFCDPDSYGSAMKEICSTPPSDKTQNMDVNYTRLVDARKTLNIDFSSGAAATDDSKSVIALANNLYAHEVLERMNPGGLQAKDNVDNRSTYLDQRAIVAKRSVAENSFNAIVGMKSSGATGSKKYMQKVLEKLGLDATNSLKYLGDNPSYEAQMEVLTKKLYQDPAFYANLMDTPANVERQYAALQAFGLMQRRDIFETILRSEMLLSTILEMEISTYQDDVQNQQNQ